MLTSNEKGNIAEAAIALEAIKLEIDVLKPVAEHGRYDLLFAPPTRLTRLTRSPSTATNFRRTSSCQSRSRQGGAQSG